RLARIVGHLENLQKRDYIVVRDGQKVVIDEENIVPGDIVIVQDGQKVPADGRIIMAYDLVVDESMLTGESRPVKKMVEFSDMIKQFVEKDKCPPLDVVFLDEAQDLNPLQWDMFSYIESRCKRSYIAGDDDQTIYTFQGANPNIFINLKGEVDPRIESRRVPRSIHKLALSILDNIDNRMIKTWLPRDAEGKIYQNESIENLDFSKGEWMILARTNKMLEPVKEYLSSLNLRFDSKINDLLPYQLLEAYRIWVRLNQGATVGAEEAKKIYRYLTVKDNLIKEVEESLNEQRVHKATLSQLEKRINVKLSKFLHGYNSIALITITLF
uniref:P-type ATPase n=1 Tax=Undibacterium luofuense TaxID=2828733 RepID=UPI0030EB8276